MTITTSEITDYFRGLPADRLDQTIGLWTEGTPCCVGAHLAHLLSAGTDYLDGADVWANLVGGNRAHAILILRECGAPRDPFSSEPWLTPPAEVFARAEQVEELPSLRGADLRDAVLMLADLRGSDLSRADLRGADLSGTDLSGANLSGTDLSGAKLEGADLDGAVLEGAVR